MTFLKTFFTITLLTCFLTAKTNAQVGLTINNMKKSVVIKPINSRFKLKANALNIPKVSYRESVQSQRMLFDPCTNAANAVISNKSTLVERTVGILLILTHDKL
jgi:hypothetical protein